MPSARQRIRHNKGLQTCPLQRFANVRYLETTEEVLWTLWNSILACTEWRMVRVNKWGIIALHMMAPVIDILFRELWSSVRTSCVAVIANFPARVLLKLSKTSRETDMTTTQISSWAPLKSLSSPQLSPQMWGGWRSKGVVTLSKELLRQKVLFETARCVSELRRPVSNRPRFQGLRNRVDQRFPILIIVWHSTAHVPPLPALPTPD